MPIGSRFIIVLFVALMAGLSALAQEPASQAGADVQISQDVLIIIQQEKVRFTAQRAVQEMRLQITDQNGELVYDSGPVPEPELNWPLQNGNGGRIKSGLYAYTLSVKEAGAETARVRRGHFIVDRAQERDGNTDRLWITSQTGAGVGTGLTVAQSENTIVAGASTSNELISGQQTGGTTRDANSRAAETETKNAAKAPVQNLVSGTANSIAKFTSATDLGNSVMTEVNGNIGVGTTSPHHRLSVSGGPQWTSNGWRGAVELDNISAIGWRANAAGNRFGLGQTNGGFYFFRTASDPGTFGSPANYDLMINDG